MCKVSVIIPSLNSIRYLRQCLDSVVSQSLREVEIICVDAGSEDGTAELIREYAARDGRVRMVTSDRRSYGYQMNLGIGLARGEYIGIVESDDFVAENMYAELYAQAVAAAADFVKADFFRFYELDGKIYPTRQKQAAAMYYQRVIDVSAEPECMLFPVNTWTGIYKREFLLRHNIRHNETPGAAFQDNGFMFQCNMHAKRLLLVDKAYYYCRRDNESSSVLNKKLVCTMADEYKYIFELLVGSPLFECFVSQYVTLLFINCEYNLYRIADADREAFLERMRADFSQLAARGCIDGRVAPAVAFECQLIAEDFAWYRETVVARFRQLFNAVDAAAKLVLCGAGSEDLRQRLVQRNQIKKVAGIFATAAELRQAAVAQDTLVVVAEGYKKAAAAAEELAGGGYDKVALWPDKGYMFQLRRRDYWLRDNIGGREFYVYGAGKIGAEVMAGLLRLGYRPRGVVVSSAAGNPAVLCGVSVIALAELKADAERTKFLIAVNCTIQEEIIMILKQRGYCNYILLDNRLWK